MRVLALDTTTRAGSVAIVENDRVLAEQAGDATRSHAERLPMDIVRALAACGLRTGDIDVFAVAAGPGLFTGLRIGIATIQGLALVGGKRVVPVSPLAALAEAGGLGAAPGTIVGAWMDAHRRDVFTALFRLNDRPPCAADHLIALDPPAVGDPASTLERWNAAGLTPRTLVGDGAVLYAGLVGDVLGSAAKIIAPPPLAPIIGHMAVALARRGDTVDPAALQPWYLRRPDVEIIRETRRQEDARRAAHD